MRFNWNSDTGKQIIERTIQLRENKKRFPEIARIIYQEFNVDLDGDVIRKGMNRHSNANMKIPKKQEASIEIMKEVYQEDEKTPEDEDAEAIAEAREKAKKDRDNRLLKKLLKERGTTEMIVEMFENTIQAYDWQPIEPPAPINPTTKREEALLLFSDAQIGEEIKPEDTNGLGEYNLQIFADRMDKLVDQVREITFEQSYSRRINTLNIAMLGDNVDGIGIYRGQEHHLDALVVEQVLFASEKIAQSILKLLSSFNHINIWAIVGNHGRIGRKGENPSHVNFDYLLYKNLELLLKNYSDRITWTIPKSNWTLAEINNQGFLLLHGDTIKGWNGIPYYGIDRADSRLTKMLSAFGKTYRYLCLGHHHNPGDMDSANGEKILNGTMVGGSDLSINQMHTSSRPSQWFFGVDEKKGITWRHKILLDE